MSSVSVFDPINNQNFHDCMCQPGTGSTPCSMENWDQNSGACHDLEWNSFGWTVMAAVFILSAFIFFPCIFYMSRCCCRCCGGRHATRGCCCSESSTRATFPGYKNRSIIVTKLVVLGATGFAGILYANLHHANRDMHTSMLNAINTVESTAKALSVAVPASISALSAVELLPSSYVAAGPEEEEFGKLSEIAHQASKDLSTAWTVFDDLRTAENTYREPIVRLVGASGLVVLGVGVVLMLFNCRALTGLVMVTLCMAIGLVASAATGMGIVAVATNVGCGDYGSTVLPVVLDVAKHNRVCENTEAADRMQSMVNRAVTFARNGASPFCEDVLALCNAAPNGCSVTPCSNVGAYTHTPQQAGEAPYAVSASVESVLEATLGLNTESGAQDRVSAMLRVLTAVVDISAGISAVRTCQPLQEAMLGPVHESVCVWRSAALRYNLSKMSTWLGVTIPVLMIGAVGLILGMKRFRALNTYRHPADEVAFGLLVDPSEVKTPCAPCSAVNYGAVNNASGHGCSV